MGERGKTLTEFKWHQLDFVYNLQPPFEMVVANLEYNIKKLNS